MTSAVAKPWTRQDFLEWEALQRERFEFVDGAVRSMVGETLAHNRIVRNLILALTSKLKGMRCDVFFESVKVEAAPDFFYPDLFVACGELPPDSLVVGNPVVIVEVASRTTSAYDRGRKRAAYTTIDSLRHYVLVGQYEAAVEILTRAEPTWRKAVYKPGQEVPIEAIDVALSFAEIYEGTPLDPGRAVGA